MSSILVEAVLALAVVAIVRLAIGVAERARVKGHTDDPDEHNL